MIVPRRVVSETFSSIFARAPGRIIVTSFASNAPRVQETVDTALRYGRRIALLGHSLMNVMQYATAWLPKAAAGADDSPRAAPGVSAERSRRDHDRFAGRADVGALAFGRARSPRA